MRRARLLVLLVALGGAPAIADAPPAVLALEAPPGTSQSRRLDVDGDGRRDLLLVGGRTIHVFLAKAGRAPRARPDHVVVVPADASFADVQPATDGAPATLVALGRKRIHRLPLGGAGAPTVEAMADLALDWTDGDSVQLVTLVSPEGGLLLPVADGWQYRPPRGTPVSVPLAVDRRTTAPGPFVEDRVRIVVGWPRVRFDGAPLAGGTETFVWALAGQQLVAHGAAGSAAWDLSFLPIEDKGDRRLVDLNGDGRPDLLHRAGSNKEGRYAFFHTPAARPGTAKPWPAVGPDPRPARTLLRLSGYQLEPSFVDLDADGRLDLVLTTIGMDVANMVRAVTSGRVTAKTRAFLNRAPAARTFEDRADAAVSSDVEVAIRFTYAGTVKVERSLTILVDGDHDGDGRRDLVVRTSPTTLEIRSGTASGVWAQTGRTVAIPSTAGTEAVDGVTLDLDGDGADEIVLVYRGKAGAPTRVYRVAARP